MKQIIHAIALSLILSTTASAEAPKTLADAAFLTSSGENWKLLWNDEFDGDKLDERRWAIGLPWPGTDGEGRHHNEQYASYIMDHNVVVEDGKLKLLTRREDVTDNKGRTFHFTQGLITTAKTFRHRYGYWEARVKLPVEAGPGMWPAFWTLAEGWPPEMDICEIWTSSNRSHQGLCYRPEDGGRKERWDDVNTTTPLPTDWTTYGMEWGPGYQIYNVNGKITHRVYGPHVTEDKHYVLLNSGIESANPPTPATVFPNAFEVDYVRIYDRPDEPLVHNAGFEHEDRRPWGRSGQVVVVPYGARSGQRALRVDARGREGEISTSEQTLFGLRPNTTYVLTGHVKMLSDGGEARLGVKDHGGEETFARAEKKLKDYQPLEVKFTTGPETTTAIIYCFIPTQTGAALFDDVSIRQAD